MSRANVDVIRHGWDAWVRGDLPALFDNFDDEVVWDTIHFRDWPESAYHGVEGVKRFLAEWLEVWDQYEIRVERVVAASDDRVLSVFTHQGVGRDGGLSMEMRMAQIATLRDGKVTRVDNYDDPDEALKAAGLRDYSDFAG